MTNFWKNGLDFKGIESRKGFWTSYLGWLALPSFILGVLDYFYQAPAYTNNPSLKNAILILAIYMMIALIPSISLTVRRFHDLNKSGWHFLIHFVPFIGTIIVIVFMALPSVPNNRYK